MYCDMEARHSLIGGAYIDSEVYTQSVTVCVCVCMYVCTAKLYSVDQGCTSLVPTLYISVCTNVLICKEESFAIVGICLCTRSVFLRLVCVC